MSTQPPRPAPRRHRPHLARKLVVVAAVGAALAVWAVASYGLGIVVRSPQMGASAPEDIGALKVAATSLAASLAGWAALATLERLTSRARLIWTAAAGVAAALSLGAPTTGEGITASNQVVLVALHLVVAAVMIPGLLATAPADQRPHQRRPLVHGQEVSP